MDIIVIGAGAAGLWAAERMAHRGRSVLLLEKTSRAGTKILASGGTRCNLTTTLTADAAARLFGPAERFIQPALRALPPAEVRKRFHGLGVPTVEEPELEKVFPASDKASDVRDALLRAALSARVDLMYDSAVRAVEPSGDGWTVSTQQDRFTCQKVILCAGGSSYPRTGCTGDGYNWLRTLDLPVIDPVPALVPLRSGASWVHALSGVSLPQTEARLLDAAGRTVARRARPVLFTHVGLSGPGAMDLSAHVARGGTWTIALDLMPNLSDQELQTMLVEAAGRPGGCRLIRAIGEGLPARVLGAAAHQAGISEENPALHQLDRSRRLKLVDALKGLRVPISGVLGWDHAEVTAGGLALEAVDRRTFEVRRYPGLFVIGELLDLTGPIGGLNFQAAFSSAEAAARHLETSTR